MFSDSWNVMLTPSQVLAKIEWNTHPELSPDEQAELAIERKAYVAAVVREENRSRCGIDHHGRFGEVPPLLQQKYDDCEILPEVRANIERLIGKDGLGEDGLAVEKALCETLSEAISNKESRRRFLAGAALAAAGGGIALARALGLGQQEGHAATEDEKRQQANAEGERRYK